MMKELTEREEKIVSYMTNLVATSIERIYKSANEMIKFNSGVVTALTTLAAFFQITPAKLIIPVMLFALGLAGFIVTTQLVKTRYVVGEVESSIDAYQKLLKWRSLTLRLGYAFTYLGFVWFLFILLSKGGAIL